MRQFFDRGAFERQQKVRKFFQRRAHTTRTTVHRMRTADTGRTYTPTEANPPRG